MKAPNAIFSQLHLFWQMISSLLGLYALYFLRPFLSLDGEKSNDIREKSRGCPLILVHPAIQSRAAWYLYQAAFRKAGFQSIYYFEYSCRETSLNAVAERLAVLIQDVVTRNPGAKPVLIGASLGGLVARASLCFLPEPEGLGGVISLACPHRGSRLAKLMPQGLFPLIRSISYDSPAIRELESKEAATPAAIPKTAFYSCLDELVKPLCALFPPHYQGWKEVETIPMSHMSIMLHPSAIDLVVKELRDMSNTTESTSGVLTL